MNRVVYFFLTTLIFLQVFFFLHGEEIDSENGQSNLMRDLLIVNYWNQKLNEKFPVLFNHLLQGGYFSMPSARMGHEGEIGAGYGYVPPYIIYSGRFQLADFLEISGNYRIFKGVEDPVLTKKGFGDFSDKGANLKISIFSPEATHYHLPGLAIGLEDFIGTKAFQAYYIVLTQVFLKQHLEVSLGYGANRIHGWFGGASWMPFRHSSWKLFKDFAFVAEYDAIPYHDESIEKHPKGRKKSTPFQFGIKYRAFNSIDLSLAYIRGEKLAFTASGFYNFGYTKGFLPKLNDPLPYKSPVNTQPLGMLRPSDTFIQEMVYAFGNQGFYLSDAWLCDRNGSLILRIKISNLVYRDEHHIRTRLNALLASLIPEDIDGVIVTFEASNLPIQELHYNTSFLRLFKNKEIGHYELDVLTPYREATWPNIYTSTQIFQQDLDWWNLEVLPKTETLFGSASGKFKYALGLSATINGFILNEVFYSVLLGYYFSSYLKTINDIDQLNPSQIINVRTDSVNYYRQKGLTIDEAFLEKMWNWGKGFYTKISLGLFEPAYGGCAFEWLYYPVNSDWAVGMDYALLKKRAYHGIDFTSDVRKLHGFKVSWVHFLPSQYFLNLYYNWRATSLDFKASAGKFLANDWGVRTEVSRYFPSGLKMGIWYTYTGAHDKINNSIYHDKGVFISVPLDIFYTSTCRSRWGYGMAAWLRDVGASACTGNHLYDLINQERQN